jgi:hypothetical protein
MSFGWVCVPDTPEGFRSAFFFGLYDAVHQTWNVDFAYLDLASGSPALTDAELAREKAAYKIFPIQAKNSTGAAITEDDLIGEPAKRVRRFSFCLRKPPVALCGSSQQVKRLADPKSDVLPYMLEVIQSIEFTSSGTSATSPAPAAAAP